LRKIFEFLLGLFIFLSSVAYFPGQGFDDGRKLIFRVGVTALLIFSMYLKPIRFVCSKWLNSCLALCFISYMLLGNGVPQANATDPLINILLSIILFYIIANYVENKNCIINALCFVILANASLVLLQVTGYDPICLNDLHQPNTITKHMTGFFDYKFYFGVYFGIITPFLLFSRRWFFGILSAILTICSLSWSAIGTMLMAVIAILYFKNKKACIASIVVVIGSVLILYFGYLQPREYFMGYTKDSSGTAWLMNDDGSFKLTKQLSPLSLKYKIRSRLDTQMKVFIPVMAMKPYFGYGLGSFVHIGPALETKPYGTAKDCWSDYLERSIECGIGIVVLMGFLFWSVIKRFNNTPLFFSIAGIPIAIGFHSLLGSVTIGVLFITLYAMWESEHEKN